MTHLLVTNDFPPKVGGIQSYLWELWRRLDPATFGVLTAWSHPEAAAFDREQAALGIRIERVPSRVLVPSPRLARRIRAAAARIGARAVVFDPAFPLAVLGTRVGLPYAVVLHGAEVAVPGRLPAARELLTRLVRRSELAVCAGSYPATEAGAGAAGTGDAAGGGDPARRRPRPLPPAVAARAAGGPGPLRTSDRGSPRRECEPARPAQGNGRADRRRRPARARR